LDTRKTGYNLLAALPLLVVAVYRVAQCVSTKSDTAVRSLATFWILMVLFELYVPVDPFDDKLMISIAFVILLAISLPTWYPAVKKDKDVKEVDVEMAPTKY
jgi:hypothetical protein